MENEVASSFLISVLISILRGATPLLFAALGGLLSERAGLVQIALEGFMLVGALFAAIVAHYTHSAPLGFLAAGIAGAGFSLLMSFFVIRWQSDQIVTGTALNILVMGVAPFITKIVFNSTGQTPSLPMESRFTFEPVLFAFACLLLVSWVYSRTKAGLYLRFSGEGPMALQVAGVNPVRVRWLALAGCGTLAAFGGASLSLFLSSSYAPQMTAGRGFIALAALIFGRWRPWPTAGACLLFAVFDAIQIRLQGTESSIPVQFIQILPYIITIIALAGFFGRSRAPAALGKNLEIKS